MHKLLDNGAFVALEQLLPSGMYLTQLRGPGGELHGKLRCDDYEDALESFKAFCEIAKTL